MAIKKTAQMIRVEIEAIRMLHQHGLGHIPIRWNNSKTKLGVCKGILGPDNLYEAVEIKLSAFFVNNIDYLESIHTVKHEIAHALAFRQGDKGHGKIWKEEAKKLGIKSPKSKCSVACTANIKMPWTMVVYNIDTCTIEEVLCVQYARRPSKEIYGRQIINRPETLNKLYYIPSEYAKVGRISPKIESTMHRGKK